MDATIPTNAATEGGATQRPEDAAAALPSGFHLQRDGLFWQPSDRNKPPVHVCGRLIALARTHDGSGHEWGVLLTWLDQEGRAHEWAMPRELLSGDGEAVRRMLLSRGLFVAANPQARGLLLDFLGRVEPPRMVRVVPRLGWHYTTAARVFVLPDATLGAGGADAVRLQTDRPDALPPLCQSGTLADWQAEVAAHAVGNSRLAFAIAASLAAPLLGLLGAEGGGFHLRGPSSVGKSTALQAAGSVWGGGGLRGWVRSWRTTDNALEAVAAAHCDLLLCLDEMGEAAPEAVAACAYALANGAGKGRAARDGSARRIAEWRVLFLSTGEEGLADRLAEAKGGPRRVRAGQEVRVLDIPADTGAHGLFEALHGFPDARALADALKAAAGRCYGAAGRAWLEALAADPDGMAAAAGEVSQAFLAAHVPAGASGQAQRAAGRFALVAAAGEIAAGLGLLPWPPGEAERAAATCFAAWRRARHAGDGAAEDAAAVAAVRRFLIAHGASRFEAVGANDVPLGERIVNRAGWKKSGDDGARFIIPGDIWRGEVVAGLDPEAAARACRRAGYLIPQSESEPRHVRQERIGSRTVKAYVIRDTIMGGGE